MSAQVSDSLEEVLCRSDIWRGDSFAQSDLGTVGSGFPTLDEELPGAGWPLGALTELLLTQSGVGELSLLMPVLSRLSQTGNIALVATPYRLHAPGWVGRGVALQKLWRVQTENAMDAAWATEQILASGAFAAVLSWLPQSDSHCLRRLQLAVEGRRSLAFIMRPARAEPSSSPAPLRLKLEAGEAARLAVHLIKRRGPMRSQPVLVTVARPIVSARLERLQLDLPNRIVSKIRQRNERRRLVLASEVGTQVDEPRG